MDKGVIQFSDENRENHSLDKGSIELLARGGTSDVYKIKNRRFRHLALKLYRNPKPINWNRIIYQISVPIEKFDNLSEETPSYAWPVGLVTENGKNIGIVLPYIDRSKYITLDNWVEGYLIDKLTDENKSLSRKILLLKNLAELVDSLHKINCAVVDLKPANFLIHKSAATACMLDCDSLRIMTDGGLLYPATHASPGYIAPEALANKTPVGDLGIEQDLFAFSVMVFQVLNYGIHPFQGIIAKGINAPNQDDKVEQKLYPYGSQVCKGITPLPQSVHTTFSKEVNELFEDAFVGAYPRPSAKKWVGVFDNILTHKALERCQKHPNDPTHIRFESMGCPACLRAEANAKISLQNPKLKTRKSKPKASTSTSSSSATSTPKSQLQENSSSRVLIIAAVLVVLCFWGLLYFSGQSKNHDNSHYKGSSNTEESNNNNAPVRNNTNASVRDKNWQSLNSETWRYSNKNNVSFSRSLKDKSLIIAVGRAQNGKLTPYFLGKICSLGSSISYSTTNNRPSYGGEDWYISDTDSVGIKVLFPKYSKHSDQLVYDIKYSTQLYIAYLGENCYQRYATFSLFGSLAAIGQIP